MNASPDIWRHTVFGLLSPDTMRRHLTTAVLDYLRKAGLEPSGWQVVRVTSRQIDEVAKSQRAGAGQTFRYRALDALFALGPSILLRLSDQLDRPPEQLYAAAKEIKGAFPQTSPVGTIRRDLGSINLIMSLVHLSDRPENSARECLVIAGPDAQDPTRWLPGEGLAAYLTALETTQPKECRGFTEVLTALRGRIVSVLWADISPPGRALAADLARQGKLAEPKAGMQIAAELTGAGTAHPLSDVLGFTFDPSMPPVDMMDLQHILRLHKCELDPWEYAVLGTSTYFEPIRDSS